MEGQGDSNNSNQEQSNDQNSQNNSYNTTSYHKSKKNKKNYHNHYYYSNNNNNGYYNYYNNYNYNNYSYNNNYNKYDYYQENYNYNKKQRKDIEYYLNKIDKEKIIIPELTQNLINDIKKNKLSCLICELPIKKEQSIWSCNKCFSILHLNCITEWIKKNNPNFNINSKNENSILSYTCPHCKYLYESNDYPIYNCFCGKYYQALEEKNKYLDTNLIPHGCGLLCKEKICPHIKTCPVPCHPGPHVQCREEVKIFCYCIFVVIKFAASN